MEIECWTMNKIVATQWYRLWLVYLVLNIASFLLQNAAFLYGLGLVYFHYNAFQW